MRDRRFGGDGEVEGRVGNRLAIFVETVGVAVRACVGCFVDNSTTNHAELVRGRVIGDSGGHFFAVGLHAGQFSAF